MTDPMKTMMHGHDAVALDDALEGDSMVHVQPRRESLWVEVRLVGIDRPGGTGDATREDNQGLRGGESLYPMAFVERLPGLGLGCRHSGEVEQSAQLGWAALR